MSFHCNAEERERGGSYSFIRVIFYILIIFDGAYVSVLCYYAVFEYTFLSYLISLSTWARNYNVSLKLRKT